VSDSDLGAGALPSAPPQTSSVRMIASLGIGGALAGLLIVGVFTITQAPIEAHKAEVLRRAVSEVLGQPARYETLYATSSGVFEAPAAAAGAEGGSEKIYVGFDSNGRATGVAVKAAAPGFQDVITLIYGFDPVAGRLLGMKVLESKETPGLGDKIEKNLAFVAQFEHAVPPLAAVKRGTGAAGEIDAITGATISSRAVVRIVNDSLVRLRGPIETHFLESAR
jgi:electron transport complex protein RnfG